MKEAYDLAIIGAGAAGLIAADFAARIGARVALIEKDRIGGDCTWTGCIPSKALVRVAEMARDGRDGARFGLPSADGATRLEQVKAHLDDAIAQVYRATTPEMLMGRGIAFYSGAASFANPHAVRAGDRVIRARNFLIATGAAPVIPALPGLDRVPYFTYKTIFANTCLPRRLAVIGGGPVGCEIAQAYRRLGAEVVVIAPQILRKETTGAREALLSVWRREGIRIIENRAEGVHGQSGEVAIQAGAEVATADLLLVAVGRRPALDGLGLENAGVRASAQGIEVDAWLRTSARHIWACGDAIAGPQFTHVAGWQAFQAARNALLHGRQRGQPALVPRITFTDPEIAQIGLTAAEARARWGAAAQVARRNLGAFDRAVCEEDQDGFVELIAHRRRLVGATVVARHAGECASELALAIRHRLTLRDMAGAVHAYPTYGSGLQRLAADMLLDAMLTGASGLVVRAARGWSARRAPAERQDGDE